MLLWFSSGYHHYQFSAAEPSSDVPVQYQSLICSILFCSWTQVIVLFKLFYSCESNIKSEMRSFKNNENIHKKEGGSYYVVSANKASSVTL